MEIDVVELLRFIREQWHRRSTLIIILVIAVVAMLVLFSGINLEEISLPELLILVLAPALLFVAWFVSTRVPKAPKRKVGFAIAISTDTKEQRERIAKDFVSTLRELLYKSNLRHSFSIVEFPQYYAQKVKTVEDARKYVRISNCRFIIYGRARVRQIQGKDHHVLYMEGLVIHRPLPQEISKRLSVEFAELFPRKLLLSSENDIFAFEFTSEWVNLVARYIIGIASLISGDVDYSQSLFEDLQQKVQCLQTDFPAIAKIRRRLPARLTDVYLTQARFCHEEWRQTRSPEILTRVKSYLDGLERVAPGNYDGHNLRSIWHFVANRDITKAMKELQRRKGKRDATWRYNYAFLLAYEGSMKKAVKMYKRASRGDCESRTLLEIEEFICWILEQEPDKIQLHFCLGLMNLFGKKDYARALQDFKKFLEVAPPARFDKQIRLAEAYMGNIRGQLYATNSD